MQELKNAKEGWTESKTEWERNMKRDILKVKLLTSKRSGTYHLRLHQDLGWRVAKQRGKRYKLEHIGCHLVIKGERGEREDG